MTESWCRLRKCLERIKLTKGLTWVKSFWLTHKPYENTWDCVVLFHRELKFYNCGENHHQYLRHWRVEILMIWNIEKRCGLVFRIFLFHYFYRGLQVSHGCYLSFNSTSWICCFRSDVSEQGVGGYSIDKLRLGRFILKMQGNQYKNMSFIWNDKNGWI